MRKISLLAFALALVLVSDGPHALADKQGSTKDPQLAKWEGHTGKLPFVIGFEKGMAEAKYTGKPVLAFFTAIW